MAHNSCNMCIRIHGLPDMYTLSPRVYISGNSCPCKYSLMNLVVDLIYMHSIANYVFQSEHARPIIEIKCT